MKKYSILTCLCMWAGILLAQVPATPYSNSSQPLIFTVASFEAPDWQQPLQIEVEMLVGDSLVLKDSLYHDSIAPGFSCQGFDLNDSAYGAGDTIRQTISIAFDTTSLPTSYVELWLSQDFEHEGHREDAVGRIYLYFTPWRSIEVWNQGDFGALNRVWMQEQGAGTFPYVAQSQVPGSNIPTGFVVQEDWQENFYDVFVEGLGYSIPMMAIHPDSLTAADSLSAYKRINPYLFNGRVTGEISSDFFQDGTLDHDFQVQRGLAGIRVELWNWGGLVPIASGVTDMDGAFDFPYSTYKSLPAVRFYLKFKALCPEHDIRGYTDASMPRVARANTPRQWVSYNAALPNNTEDMDFGDMELNEGVFRGVSQSFLAYEFIENESSYNLVDGLNVLVLSANVIRQSTFFWPNILCEHVPYGGIITQFNGNVMQRPSIFLERHRDENTAWHEFGHFVMWNVQNFCWTELVTSTGSHSAQFEENPRLSWNEGFASGMETITDLHYHYIDQESTYDRALDYEIERKYEDLNGYISEYYITMALRDMFDGATQVQNCYDYNSQFGVQPTFKDVPTKGDTATWKLHEDVYEFPLDLIFDAVALGSTVDPEGNGQISSSGEFFANLMQVANCQDREALKIIFDENLVGWRTVNPAGGFFFDGLSADIIGRNGAEETMDGTNENLEEIQGGFNLELQGAGITTLAVDFEPLNLDVNTIDATYGDFNVGESTCLIDPLLVSNNHSLSINDASAFDKWQIDEESNLGNSHIEVGSYGRIEIAAGGHLQVGSATQSAELEMFRNLVLKGSLTVANNSELVIAANANLVVAPGHQIVLEGANSVLRIVGAIDIQANTEFSFTGAGKVIFDAPSFVSTDQLQFAQNSGFVLKGNDSSHVMAEVHSLQLAALADQNALGTGNYIRMEDGTVLLGDGSNMLVSIPIEMEDVRLDALSSNDLPRGLYLSGQEGIDISHCSFNNMRFGIRSFNSYGNLLELYDCDFNDCEYGVWQQGYSVELYGSDFNRCDYGLFTVGASLPGYLAGCTASDCETGLLFFGNTTLHLNSSSIHDNSDYGVDFYGRTFSAWCGDVKDNYIGFQGICNEVVLSSKFKPYSGYMDFSGNRYGVNMQGTNLRLNWGNNDLVSQDPLTTPNLNVFSRNVAWYATHAGVMSTTQILASGNKWDNNPGATTNKPIFQSTPLQAPFGNQHMTVIEPFTGVLSPATVKSFSSIAALPSCPAVVSSEDVNGFALVENEFHNPEYGTPELDMEPLTGNTQHEFQGLTLQAAMATTLEDMYDETRVGRYTEAAGRFADILRSADNNLWQHAPDEYVSYSLDYAYLRMMEAMEYACLYEGALDNGSTALVDEVIDVQETLIAMIDAETDPNMDLYHTRFKYNLDLATTHWIVKDYVNASATLAAMQLWTVGNELEIVNSTQCIIDFEQDLINGTILLSQVDDSPYPCKLDFELPDLRGEQTGILIKGAQETALLELFPNPATDQLTVRFAMSRPQEADFIVYNAKGQQVRRIQGLQTSEGGDFVLNTSSLGNGIYYLKAFSKGKEATATFSVQH